MGLIFIILSGETSMSDATVRPKNFNADLKKVKKVYIVGVVTKIFINTEKRYQSRLRAIELYNQQLKQTIKETIYEDTLTDDEDTHDLLKISKMLINEQKTSVFKNL